MHFDHHFTREVLKFIGYFAGQAAAVKTMVNDKRSCVTITQTLLAAIGTGHNLFLHFYGNLLDAVTDLTNTILDHPNLDDETRSKVEQMRVSANDMEAFDLAKMVEELQLIQNQLP